MIIQIYRIKFYRQYYHQLEGKSSIGTVNKVISFAFIFFGALTEVTYVMYCNYKNDFFGNIYHRILFSLVYQLKFKNSIFQEFTTLIIIGIL